MGFATLEWLVAGVLVLILAALASGASTHLLRTSLGWIRAAEWDLDSSLAGQILASEVGRASLPDDVRTHRGDSITLRGFRGTAWICRAPVAGASTITVVYNGERTPNPAKDSVLVLGAGATQVLALTGRRRAASCPGAPSGLPIQARTEDWDLSGRVPREAVLRLFESGSYSIAQGSLRYRVGRGGRQPVVGLDFDSTSSLRQTGGPTPGAALTVRVGPAAYRNRAKSVRRVAYPRRPVS